MKKKLFHLSIVAFLLLAGVGCASFGNQNQTTRTGEQITVATTVFPLYDITRQIVQDDARIVLVSPPGQSPHTFEPAPSLARDVANAHIAFAIGHGLDHGATNFLEANLDGPIVIVDNGISLREGELHDDEDEEGAGIEKSNEEDEGEAVDPHYWLDPENAMLITMTIANELAEIDPVHASTFLIRAEAYVNELRAKDAEWQAELAEVEKQSIITFHDAFGYFAAHFGIAIAATVEPFAGKEPTPQYLVDLQGTVKDSGVRHLFTEPQLSNNNIQAFASDNNLVVGVLDPVGGLPGRESYIDLMSFNVNALKRAWQEE